MSLRKGIISDNGKEVIQAIIRKRWSLTVKNLNAEIFAYD